MESFELHVLLVAYFGTSAELFIFLTAANFLKST